MSQDIRQDTSPEPTATWTGPERRRSENNRRETVVDRRTDGHVTGDGTGLERRRGPGRRRTDFMKAAEEGQMDREQFLFVMAIDAYKRVNQKPYPTWTEVLEVIRKLGYRKTTASELNLASAEDWTESPDAPAFKPKA
ncbi:MAG: hypothetical protein GC164_11240 [Phycisphaera sp.]|nr:hypothetical protein [Phycisphaera sp.]